ncbi:MAG TPA: replication initiation protein, partial [Gammaproteobacteria bacterium]|nr:replication initiation protein [Gammaproteobacteria bacterium]
AKREVIKHSAAIQIENNITLLQRRTWNALLYNAYDELETKEEHAIPVKKLAGLVGYDSHDMGYLKEAALAMLRCIVQYNVLGKDGSSERWGAMALLAQVDIQKGLFSYAYSPELRRRLHNPAMYARLDLNMQKQFASKHALALWELCADYLGSGRDYGESPVIPLAEYRKLMGIADDMYPLFKLFNKRVIKEPIEEINRVSDFLVSVNYRRSGRKVKALKFKIRRITILPGAVAGQGKLFPAEDMPLVVRLLKDVGLSSSDAWDIYQRGWAFVVDDVIRPVDPGGDAEVAFVRYIREKIHLLKRRQASGKVDNSTGFLLEAIRQNYANPEYTAEKQREADRKNQQARREREKQAKALAQQKADLEQARDKELDQLSSRVAAELPCILEQAAAELLAESFGFRQFYDRDKSALENYQARKAVQMLLNPFLERHAPARFEGVKRNYALRIAAIDVQIAA